MSIDFCHLRRPTVGLLTAALLGAWGAGWCGVRAAEPANAMKISSEEWGRTTDGQLVSLVTMSSRRGMLVKITSLGTIITELHVPDRQGGLTNVVLGFDNLERYLQGHPAFGATIGRVANRIAGARFTLDGQEYRLAANLGPHHIHGGRVGFHQRVWQTRLLPVQEDRVAVEFRYLSVDGEEGYPGNLEVQVTFTLTDDHDLRIDYVAQTDRPTPVNLTNHSYFNLAGHGDVLGHLLEIAADHYTPADSALIPTGQIAPVAGTPLDFRTPQTIGSRIDELRPQPNGYDHNYVLNSGGGELAFAARAIEPVSGRVLEAWTTEPGMQLFTANFFDGRMVGTGGVVYPRHAGFCFETQHFPDSINQPHFPSVVLRPGTTFSQHHGVPFFRSAMKNTLAMVFAGGRVDELSVLTESRPKSAVVLGGCYRTIDFALSNLADTGIDRVGILTQYRPSSLMDHVGSGMAWDLVGTDRQLRFLPPYLRPGESEWYRGPADALYQNLDFIERSTASDVLVVSGDHAYRMTYEPLLRFHREHDADLTMAFTPRPDDSSRFGVGELNAVGQIVNFTEKPQYPRANLASMTVYLFRRQVLIDELHRTVAGDAGEDNFQIHEVLRRMIPRRRAYGWVYHGPWHYTRTLDEYYQFHRDLLGAKPLVDLESWRIRSNFMARRSAPPPPVRYLPGAQVDDAIVSPGCVIGGTVRNSVLSPGVRIEPGAVVTDSVLWDEVVVRSGAVLDRVISDKRTRFGELARVGEGETAISTEMPDSLTCGATIVGRDLRVPPGARIGRGCILHPGLEEAELAAAVPAGASRSHRSGKRGLAS